MADSDFMANYKVLLSNINKYAQNRTIAQMFDSMPMNENTKSQFKNWDLIIMCGRILIQIQKSKKK